MPRAGRETAGGPRVHACDRHAALAPSPPPPPSRRAAPRRGTSSHQKRCSRGSLGGRARARLGSESASLAIRAGSRRAIPRRRLPRKSAARPVCAFAPRRGEETRGGASLSVRFAVAGGEGKLRGLETRRGLKYLCRYVA